MSAIEVTDSSSPGATALPFLFVPLWSTGFVLARVVAPHAEPLTFLAVRFLVAGTILAGTAVCSRARWPHTARQWASALLAGMLIHGVYLGGVFWSVAHGLPTAISALVAGMQPLFIGLLARPLLNESVSAIRKCGIAIGAIGAAVTLAPKIGAIGQGAIPLMPLVVCTMGMVAISLGTIWQKRQGQTVDLTSNTAVQYLGALIPIGLGISIANPSLLRYDLSSVPLWIGLAWSVFGMSIGAIFLLFVLIRRGAVSQVSALFYLVPGVSALMAWIGFGERLTVTQIIGMLIAAAGVAVANRG